MAASAGRVSLWRLELGVGCGGILRWRREVVEEAWTDGERWWSMLGQETIGGGGFC